MDKTPRTPRRGVLFFVHIACLKIKSQDAGLVAGFDGQLNSEDLAQRRQESRPNRQDYRGRQDKKNQRGKHLERRLRILISLEKTSSVSVSP